MRFCIPALQDGKAGGDELPQSLLVLMYRRGEAVAEGLLVEMDNWGT
jgi:hypothetical protein